MMNCNGAFCKLSASDVCCLLRIRGELAIGASFDAANLYSVGPLGPNHDAVIRIGGKDPGAGPILSFGISATSGSGSTPPRNRQSAVRLSQPRVPKARRCFSSAAEGLSACRAQD